MERYQRKVEELERERDALAATLASWGKPCQLDGCQFEGLREKDALAERITLKQQLAEVVAAAISLREKMILYAHHADDEALESAAREAARQLDVALEKATARP